MDEIEKLWRAFLDWWAVAVALGGALVSAYNIVSQLSTTGRFELNALVAIGILFFLVFGSVAIIKAIRKTRAMEEKLKEQPGTHVESEKQTDGITAGTNTNSPIVKVEGSGVASGHDTHVHHHYGTEKKQGISNPKIEIQNVSDFLNHHAIIRIINREMYTDLEELRVELKKMHSIFNGVKSPGSYPFSPAASGFDCGDCRLGYGGGAKDIHLANNEDHNLTFLTSIPIQPQMYYTDGQRDEITYEIEVWIHGKLEGNPINPPLQFCGSVSIWRAQQSTGQISQVEMIQIECEESFRWLMSRGNND